MRFTKPRRGERTGSQWPAMRWRPCRRRKPMDRNKVENYRLGLFGRMVMGVAHEVDNHLSVVLGFSELIQLAAAKEQKVHDGAGKILSAGEKIGAIIQQFSHYVRPHAPSPEPFDPGRLIPEILQFSRYDLGR